MPVQPHIGQLKHSSSQSLFKICANKNGISALNYECLYMQFLFKLRYLVYVLHM